MNCGCVIVVGFILLLILFVCLGGCIVKGDLVLYKAATPCGKETVLLETKKDEVVERQKDDHRNDSGGGIGDSSRVRMD